MTIETEINYKAIQAARQLDRCWTLSQLADEAGISHHQAVAACSGRSVSLRVVKRCCAALGLDPDEIITIKSKVMK